MKKVVFPSPQWAAATASHIAEALPSSGSVVLTGGSNARVVYPKLAQLDSDWAAIAVFFSDERCVPPDNSESNYRMAAELLLDRARPQAVQRMSGELDPESAAREYHDLLVEPVAAGLDLLLLGMGADCHIGALFPRASALSEQEALCVAVDRPDGLRGLTLTPPALLSAKRVLLLVQGTSKAPAVKRVLQSSEKPIDCPARLLADHDDVTFLLDEAAAADVLR